MAWVRVARPERLEMMSLLSDGFFHYVERGLAEIDSRQAYIAKYAAPSLAAAESTFQLK